MQSRSLLTLFLIFFALSCAHKPVVTEKCESRVRALFDVGSGMSKVNVAEVDICPSGTRVKRVLDDKLESPLALEAGKDKRGNLSDKVQGQALVTLAELRDKVLISVREKAPEHQTVEFVAVGTHAVRTAKNSESFVKKFQNLGFTLLPLTQQQEGEFAFRGVLTKGRPTACAAKQLIVWDAGGGSQQLTSQDTDGNFHVVAIGFSSEAFRQDLVNRFGAKKASLTCSNGSPTPNPVGAKNFTAAENIGRDKARLALKAFRVNAQEQCLVGVGGLHTKAIEAKIQELWPQIRECACGENPDCMHTAHRYAKNEVACLAKFLSDKGDCDPEIKGPFSPVAVSNAYMILGFLAELATEDVRTMSVNMGNQLVTDSSLPWSAIRIPHPTEK